MPTRCPYVHAAFYLWYGTPEQDGRWRHWDHPTLPHWDAHVNEKYAPGVRFDPPVAPHAPFFPERGLYSSADFETTRAQLASLKAVGVDSVMLSWWGRTTVSVPRDSQGVDTDAIIPGVLDAAKQVRRCRRHPVTPTLPSPRRAPPRPVTQAGIGVSWHIEPYGGRSPRSVLADLRYIHEKYGSHPAIWRQGPNALPLVFLYDVSFEHAGVDAESRARMQGMWAHTVKSLRGSDADAVLFSLYLDRRDADFIRDVGFDGGYTYFGASGFTEGSTTSHWPDAHERLRSDGKHFVISARRDRHPRSVPEIGTRDRAEIAPSRPVGGARR